MPRLLVIDDSPTIRKMIIAALRPLNASFGEASSGLEAIEQLTLNPYDAVTLDLNMPDMHGLEFLHFMRDHKSLKSVPVVVITTRIDEEMEKTILTAGANRFIRKPFKPNEILEAVQELI